MSVIQVLLCLGIKIIALQLDDLVNLVKDSSVRLIHHDASDRGSLILIRNIPKERIDLCPDHSRTVVSRKPELRGNVCKSGPVHSGSKNSLPSNFAQ